MDSLAYRKDSKGVLLDEIYQDIKQICASSQAIALPVDLALQFVLRFLPLLKEEGEERGWYILWALCSPMVNSLYFPFVDAFQHTPEIDEILSLASGLFRTTRVGQDKIFGVRFLGEFMLISRSKLAVFFECPDLLRGIIAVVEGAVTQSAQEPVLTSRMLDDSYAARVLTLAAYAILPDYTGDEKEARLDSTEFFLQCDGLHALGSALDFMVKNNAYLSIPDSGEAPDLIRCTKALYMMFRLLETWQPAHVDRARYTYDRNARIRFSVTAHTLLNLRLPPVTRRAAFLAVHGFMDNVFTTDGAQALEECLLFKPFANSTALPLVVLLMTVMHTFNEVAMEVCLKVSLQGWTDCLPAVAAALVQYNDLFPLPKDDKHRQCALPRCDLFGTWVVTTLKKCGRCKAVYYCGVHHQREHWSEHKKDCKTAER